MNIKVWFMILLIIGLVFVGHLIGALLVDNFMPGKTTPISSGPWTRLDEKTLAFRGPILPGSYEEMKDMLDAQVRTLVVTSVGGEVEPAIRMGKLIWERKLNVVVQHYCLSSCANYLFLAGYKKIIKEGIVGFHGNITYSILQAGGPQAKAKEEAQKYGLSKEQQESFEKMIRKVMEMEQEFLDMIGVPQDFFSFTASILAERSQEDHRIYAFVLPTVDIFAKYGITVQGSQSMKWKKKVEQELGVNLLILSPTAP